jgi:hypothetical protein
VDADQEITARHGKVTPRTVFVKLQKSKLTQETTPITFHVEGNEGEMTLNGERGSVFIGPKR